MQLEELLNNSTKNVAQEVVTCLIPRRGEGVLVLLEGQTTQASKNKLMTKAHRSSNSQAAYPTPDTPGQNKPQQSSSGSH